MKKRNQYSEEHKKRAMKMSHAPNRSVQSITQELGISRGLLQFRASESFGNDFVFLFCCECQSCRNFFCRVQSQRLDLV
ncbi:MAG: transposase [Chloroflexi bacterium]|nr:transposase [Chloroflexota bacterium]